MSAVAPHFAFRTATLLPGIGIGPPPLPEMLGELCKADRPLALFPVRLETRFFPLPNGGSELRVRVYPDRIHIDSHEEELTQAEKTWGQHYWTQIFAAGADTQAQMNAWRQLADRYDPQRAAWIARLMRPTNVDALRESTFVGRIKRAIHAARCGSYRSANCRHAFICACVSVPAAKKIGRAHV